MRIGTVEIGGKALLAPMAGITEMPFRLLCRRMGAALTYTEMVSVNSLFFGPGQAAFLLDTHPEERPRALQLFGDDPVLMADMAARYGQDFDIIDINMGCPTPKITKSGRGSALMREPEKAAAITAAMCAAVRQPVTVKIRAGWDDDSRNAVEMALRLQDAGAAAVTVHGRTRQQFYSGRADWDIIARVRQALTIPVIGNGDVDGGEAARRMLDHTGCDAVMVGRAAQGNPWIFTRINHYLETGEELLGPTGRERYDTAMEHARMLSERQGETTAVLKMRKHMAWYTKGIHGAAAYRRLLMTAGKLSEMEEILAQCLLGAGQGMED